LRAARFHKIVRLQLSNTGVLAESLARYEQSSSPIGHARYRVRRQADNALVGQRDKKQKEEAP
jgi:hypothetical protein